MLQVKFYDDIPDELLKFAVIIAKTEGKWVFCKHRERDTYEVPGGHREPGESILETAKRELMEETGAVRFSIEPVCVYSVKGKTRINESDDDESFGMLFVAEIFSFEELHSEIEEILITDTLVENWTYPLIQPKLLEEAKRRGAISPISLDSLYGMLGLPSVVIEKMKVYEEERRLVFPPELKSKMLARDTWSEAIGEL